MYNEFGKPVNKFLSISITLISTAASVRKLENIQGFLSEMEIKKQIKIAKKCTKRMAHI